MKNLPKVLGLLIAATCFAAIWTSCEKPATDAHLASAEIDSLKKQAALAYVPGTGEIMNGIVQPHHYKLWLAGHNSNWKLAAYEADLLNGGFKRIEKYHAGSKTAQAVPMIYPELAAINKAIESKDRDKFDKEFVALTKMCNICHQATGYDFNVILVPSKSAFENQQF
jgi:hypothetical protein